MSLWLFYIQIYTIIRTLPFAAKTVVKKIQELRYSLRDDHQLAYIHRIDNVLFLHGGLAEEFVYEFCPFQREDSDIDNLLRKINGFGADEMWRDISPIWFRPQDSPLKL